MAELGVADPDIEIEREAKELKLMNPNMSLSNIDPGTAQHIRNTILARRRKTLAEQTQKLLTRRQAPGREQTLLSVRSGEKPKNLLGSS